MWPDAMMTALPESSIHVACPALTARERSPVRVCYLIDELATAGTETQLLALLQHLDRRRVRPYLCLLRGENSASRTLEPENCPVLRLGVGRLRSPATLQKAWRFVRFLRQERIDVLQTYFPDSSYFGVPLAWLAGVPNRIRTRNNLGHWLTPLHRRLGRWLNRLTTATVTNCTAARAALLEAEGPDPDSVSILENGVDLDRFLNLPAPGPGGPPVVGMVANLRPVKGPDVFLQAAALLKDEYPDVRFAIAGEGELRPLLQRQAAELGLADRFQLPGSISDIPGFLAGVHVAVLSSQAEGMSNALLEYLAASRPVVATAVGATPDVIEPGRHGLLVPPGDAGGLAAAIGRLLRDPELARRLGKAGRQRVRRFSRPAMVRRFEDYYERLTAGGLR
jgi:glycosyltransferase involved in cell wall biosynthesis